MRAKRGIKKNAGFTLVEVLVAAAIMAFCLAGLLLSYISMFTLTDFSRDMTVANNALQLRLEQIQKLNYTAASALNNTSFNLSSLGFNGTEGRGVVEVSATNYTASEAQLNRLRVVIAFRSKNRVIGEDQNLNGMLDSGEDDAFYNSSSYNGAGRLNSPVEGVLFITDYEE